MESRELKKGLISSISITFIARYINIFVNIIISAFLARLLTPEEFGVVAVVLVFITFFQIISQLGIGPAIIQNKKLSEQDISNIFKFIIAIAFFMGVIFYFFSYLIAVFYEDEVYINIGKLLSLSVFFSTLNTVPNAILRKNKLFKKIGIISIVCSSLGGILAIILALLNLSYFSIVIKSIFVSGCMFFLNLKFSKLKLKKGFNFNSIKIIKNYSLFQFLFNFINYFSRNMDNILIGKFLGPTLLGFYDKAYRLMLYPVQNLTFVITPVLHPLLSDFQDNKNKIFSVYKKMTKYLMMLGVPICIILFFYAKEIILIMYGSNWIQVVPTFKILSISIIIQIILSSSGSIFQAAGRTNMLFFSGALSAVSMVSAISIGVFLKKLEFVALGILVAMIINFFQCYYLLIVKVLHSSYTEFLRNFLNPALIGLVMIILNIIYNSFFSFSSFVINLFFGIIINLFLWIMLIILFKESKFMHLYKIYSRLKIFFVKVLKIRNYKNKKEEI